MELSASRTRLKGKIFVSKLSLLTASILTPAFLAISLPTMAHQFTSSSDLIYDTSRILIPNNNQCAGVPTCRTVVLPWGVVEANHTDTFVANCPESSPYVWHWDARYHEHLTISRIARTDYGLTFVATNRADVPGNVDIYIGCSTELFNIRVRGEEMSTSGVPSSAMGLDRGAQ